MHGELNTTAFCFLNLIAVMGLWIGGQASKTVLDGTLIILTQLLQGENRDF
jgi:hypothetical protein